MSRETQPTCNRSDIESVFCRSRCSDTRHRLPVSGVRMTSLPRNCKAYCVGDQRHCDFCGLVWDIDDPDPPVCINEAPATKENGIKIFEQLREDLKK